MSQCKGCNYGIGKIYKGFCEYCREEYGKDKGRYSQSENKKVYTDKELEEMPDGDFINTFGYGINESFSRPNFTNCKFEDE